MTDFLLDSFIKNSSEVANQNLCVSEKELLSTLNDVPFYHLPSFDKYKRCDIKKDGISCACIEADWGIAETGTVIIDSHEEEIRLSTSLAEHLQVVLLKSKIVGKLPDIKSYIKEKTEQNNTYIAFITGASRTADIERVLTIGVHGPVKMTVYIINDL